MVLSSYICPACISNVVDPVVRVFANLLLSRKRGRKICLFVGDRYRCTTVSNRGKMVETHNRCLVSNLRGDQVFRIRSCHRGGRLQLQVFPTADCRGTLSFCKSHSHLLQRLRDNLIRHFAQRTGFAVAITFLGDFLLVIGFWSSPIALVASRADQIAVATASGESHFPPAYGTKERIRSWVIYVFPP